MINSLRISGVGRAEERTDDPDRRESVLLVVCQNSIHLQPRHFRGRPSTAFGAQVRAHRDGIRPNFWPLPPPHPGAMLVS